MITYVNCSAICWIHAKDLLNSVFYFLEGSVQRVTLYALTHSIKKKKRRKFKTQHPAMGVTVMPPLRTWECRPRGGAMLWKVHHPEARLGSFYSVLQS